MFGKFQGIVSDVARHNFECVDVVDRKKRESP